MPENKQDENALPPAAEFRAVDLNTAEGLTTGLIAVLNFSQADHPTKFAALFTAAFAAARTWPCCSATARARAQALIDLIDAEHAVASNTTH